MGLGKFVRSLFGGSTGTPKHAAWDDPVDIAALAVPEVASGQRPALLVVHDLGLGEGLGGWLFLDGDDTAGREPTAPEVYCVLAEQPVRAGRSAVATVRQRGAEYRDSGLGFESAHSSQAAGWVSGAGRARPM
jgi:hypothetical protein